MLIPEVSLKVVVSRAAMVVLVVGKVVLEAVVVADKAVLVVGETTSTAEADVDDHLRWLTKEEDSCLFIGDFWFR